MSGELDNTAAALFAVMIANGKVLETVHGGPYDGLQYFEIELDGVRYWVVEGGLVDPLRGARRIVAVARVVAKRDYADCRILVRFTAETAMSGPFGRPRVSRRRLPVSDAVFVQEVAEAALTLSLCARGTVARGLS